MDNIKLIVCDPVLGKFPQKDGGGSITFQYSSDQHLKATAIVLTQQEAATGIELSARPVENE